MKEETDEKNGMRHLLLAIGMGIGVFFIAHTASYGQSGDFTWTWYAAQVLLSGENPYYALPITTIYPLNDYLYYPIYPILFSVPFAFLSKAFAGPLFAGVSSACLAYVILKKHSWVHLCVVCTSVSYFAAVYACQWSIILSCVPFLFFLKPNIGLASLYHFTKKHVAVFFVFFVCLNIWIIFAYPWWITSWFDIIIHHKHANHQIPIVHFPLLIVPALLFIRQKKTWPLILMCFLPQSVLYYDQFIFFSLFKDIRQKIIYWIIEWLGFFVIAYVPGFNKYTIIIATTFFTAYVLLASDMILTQRARQKVMQKEGQNDNTQDTYSDC